MRFGFVVALIGAGAALACGSDKKQPPVATRSPLADSADQVMYGARFNLTDEGVSRAHLVSDTAYFFDDNTRIELEKVNIVFYTVTGQKDAVLTSRRGTYNNRTNNMIARQNVVVVSEDGRRLTSEELKYNQQTNQISSDSAFVMTEPDRRLEGIGFRSDPNMRNIQILKGASGIAKGVSTQSTGAPAPRNAPIVLPAPSKPSTVLPAPSSTPPRR